MYAKYLIYSAVARRRKVGGGGTIFFSEIAKKKKRPQRRKSERYGRYGATSSGTKVRTIVTKVKVAT